jgi:hypothetical protein
MSVETLGWLGLIAGGLLLVVSVARLIVCVRRDRPIPPDDRPGAPYTPWSLTGGWRVCWPVRIWLGLLTLSFVILILASAALVASLGEKEPNVFITDPDGTHPVSQHTLVRGTYRNLPDGEQIWLLVSPHADGVYYPQSEVVRLGDQEEWSTRAVIGGADDAGSVYNLMAVLANAEASALLKENMTPAESDGLGPMLTTLPAGVRIYEQYTVVRQ